MGLFMTPEELRKMGWMPQDEASKLLGLPQGEMISWDYIDSEQTASDGKNWVLLLPGVGGGRTTTDDRPPDSDSNVKCKVSNAKCKVGRKRTRPVDASAFPVQERIPSKRSRWGERPILISVEEAAARLGWSVAWTRRQLQMPYFEKAYDRDGRLCAVLQSVEWWLSAHAEQRDRRRAERERKLKAKRLESGVGEVEEWGSGGEENYQLSVINDQLSMESRWMSGPEAAATLQI